MPRTTAAPWEKQIRAMVKAAHGAGWGLHPHRGGRVQISRRWSDGTRSCATVPIAWAPSSGPALLALIEQLARLMAPTTEGGQGLGLAEAIQLAMPGASSGSAAAIRTGAVNWPAAAEAFRRHQVESTGKVAALTWQRGYKRHVGEVVELLTRRRGAPKGGKAVLERLVAEHPTAPGGTGRRERLGNASRFLTFAVERCGAPDRYRPPASLRELVGSRVDRSAPACPLLDDQLLRLLDGIGDPQWRLAVGLAGVFGLRPVEIGCCRPSPDGGALLVAGVKRNSSGRAGDRRVQPLDPEGRPGLGADLLAQLAERGREGLPPDRPASYWSTRLYWHLRRHVPLWGTIAAEAEETGRGHLTIYGFRHAYAWRGSVTYGLPVRVLARLMGHDPATHLRHYGAWAGDAEVAEAVAAAAQRVQQRSPLAAALD